MAEHQWYQKETRERQASARQGFTRASRVYIVETGATVKDSDASDDGSDFSLDHPKESPCRGAIRERGAIHPLSLGHNESRKFVF